MHIASAMARARNAARPSPLLAVLLGGCCALMASASAQADYVFTTIDYPGATFTDVRGLNNMGQVVGYASLDGITNFGFVYSGGRSRHCPRRRVV